MSETIWKTLTTGELIARWLMAPTGFEPVKGKEFTFQTTPAGAWDGVIRCQVLEAVPNERLVYAWKADMRETSDAAQGWTPSSRGSCPGLKTERGLALSIPASSRRTTIQLSRPWVKAGRRLSDALATLPAQRTDAIAPALLIPIPLVKMPDRSMECVGAFVRLHSEFVKGQNR